MHTPNNEIKTKRSTFSHASGFEESDFFNTELKIPDQQF